MDNTNIWPLFNGYNIKYFGGKLDKVRLSWSPRMTLCAGKTAFKVWRRGGTSCSIRLSQPLLSQRPHSDTVNTLLHEMIHAYLHVTQGLNYRDSHGPEFRSHMKRINAQEGSKITIYHNFRKEVDKYRVNVYRCDGPCVSRRPFFGILRRAIARPPGPEDKWWPRHQSECGGTFHKIEGPGAISTQGKSAEMNRAKQNYKVPSMPHREVQSFDNYNSNNNTNRKAAEMSRKNKFSNKRNPVGATNANPMGSFEEDSVLKRIRDKYANARQTIMLSKEASEQLNGGRYRHPAPFGNYVEGKMNYNYQGHSPKQIKIGKYLNKYRDARKCFEPHSSKSDKSLPFPQNNRKSLDSDFNSRKAKTVSKCKENESERHFNYDYHSKTPSKIRLEKYINRYRVAVCSGSHGSKTSPISNMSSKSVNLVPARVEKLSPRNDVISCPGPSKTTLCPICSIKIPVKEYEQHLGECFGNDEFAIDFDESDNIAKESSELTPSKNDATDAVGRYWDDLSAATNCSNCGSKVLMAEMKVHLQYCTASDDETDLEESPQKVTAQGSKDRLEHAATSSMDSSFVSCPSCMERVREENIQEHLDICLNFISEEF